MELQADSFTLQSPMRKSCHYPNFRAERAFFVASRRLTVAVDFNPRWWCAADDSRLATPESPREDDASSPIPGSAWRSEGKRVAVAIELKI
jgi:hypothetical protein